MGKNQGVTEGRGGKRGWREERLRGSKAGDDYYSTTGGERGWEAETCPRGIRASL